MRRRASDCSWEPVWHGQGDLRAHAVAGFLDACGVRARLRTSSGRAAETLGILASDWTILVRSRDAAHARHALAQHDETGNLVEPESDGGLTSGQLMTLRFALIAVLLVLLVALVEVARG